MSDLPPLPTGPEEPLPENRCPNCDSVVSPEDAICLMCGVELKPHKASEEADESLPVQSGEMDVTELLPEPEIATEPISEVFESVMKERQSPVTFWFTAIAAVIIIVIGALVLRYQDSDLQAFLVRTETPFPPTATNTATWTPLPEIASQPTDTPTVSPTPVPSSTPQPPISHIVNSGETLIGLSLRYRVSVESIAAANGFGPDSSIQAGQTLAIPWPTPTPPLVPVAVTVNGVLVVAEPEGCERREVRGGDSISGIAAQYEIDIELLMRVNRITEETILQPGDSLCIPRIVVGGLLPPTPGPSPTTTPTRPPAGPRLLYPVRNSFFDLADDIVTLQWTAVKDLAESEWYMVELADMDEVDSLPRRVFTQDTSFQLPSSWRPKVEEMHQMRWRVSIVQVTGTRSDGGKIYTYGGESSQDAFFSWMGAIPSPTPTPTIPSSPTP